jgi:short-subunit dehydrogenase
MTQRKTVLIVGGSSGLGLELALCLKNTHNVIVTGRKKPDVSTGVNFIPVDFKDPRNITVQNQQLLFKIGEDIDTLVCAAGFYQEGTLAMLRDTDIEKMITVGFSAPVMLVAEILRRQQKLSEFIAITSTSQWIPRKLEPVYTGVKAGLAMFAKSLSLDESVEKVLVAAPAGMKTDFWRDQNKDTSGMLEADWVASEIMELRERNYAYMFAKIMRGPARVEVEEITP